MIKLYGLRMSNYYSLVKAVLIEKGLDFEEVKAPPTQKEDNLARSPMGKMPSIEVDGQYMSESLASATGTKLVISSGVMITPQACIPVFLTEPSRTLALFMVWASKSTPSAKFRSSFIFSTSSDLNLSLSCASVFPKILFSLVFGISFAILSASCNGKSNTLAVSLMDDFAAIVP